VKWGWIVAACILAGWVAARRHRQKRWLQAVELAATAVALLIGFGVIHLPNLEKLLEDVGTALGPWTYLLVGFLAFAETGAFLGFIAPGETAVIVGGLVAGQGEISLLVLIAVVWVCAVLGDITSFELGRRRGRDWLLRHGERLKITEERLEQVERFFEQRGSLTIVVGRFLGFVRPLLPFIAGAARWRLRRYLRYDIFAAGAWSVTFCVLGYVFWHSFDQLTTYVSRGLFALGTVVVLVVAVVALVQLRRDAAKRAAVRDWLEQRSDQRGWRLVARAAAPLWRTVGRPAGTFADRSWRLVSEWLSLELITLLTLLAAGALAFGVLGILVEEQPVPRIDTWAFDLADPLQTPMLVDVAKVVTALGAFPTVAVAALATAIWALIRRHTVDAVALVVGVALSDLAVHVAKDAYDRPRPSGSLVDTGLSAYPSGHALQSVTWVACAVVLVRGGAGWASRIAAVTVAIALVAVVCVTRVFLRAHYLADVLGGAALGVAVWAAVGTVALLAGSAVRRD
jgi:membrane protein DedA with SNARE-associated domain/membrane-associated phospholipid phosphatase